MGAAASGRARWLGCVSRLAELGQDEAHAEGFAAIMELGVSMAWQERQPLAIMAHAACVKRGAASAEGARKRIAAPFPDVPEDQGCPPRAKG